MTRRLSLLLWSWMLFVPAVSFAEEPAVKLKADDRIVFLGDSITQGGAGPNGYVTMIRQALDKKHADLTDHEKRLILCENAERLFDLVVTGLPALAPKGTDSIAQGNALG